MNRLLEWLGRCPVRVRRGLARGAWWSLYPCSAYWRLGGNDPAVESILRRFAARPGLNCWDVGAHHGIYAVGLARAVGPGGRVDAFEPDPVSFGRLCWHRRLNRLLNLHPHPVAVSSSGGPARLFHYHGFGATTSHLPYPGESLVGVPSREVTTIALDDWVRAGRLPTPHFVKLDIEGHGGPALAGMHHVVATARPVILFAVHSREEHAAARAELLPLGYRLDPAHPADGPRLERDHFGELLCLPPEIPATP